MSEPTIDSVLGRLHQLSAPLPRLLPTGSDVHAAEEELGFRLPSDLRRFLLEVSDLVLGLVQPVTVGTVNHADHTDVRSVVRHAREVGVPDDLLPVCEHDGDFACLTPSGEVVIWSHDYDCDKRWPSFAAWLDEVWIGQQHAC